MSAWPKKLLRRIFQQHAEGGLIPPPRHGDDIPMFLSEGKQITDPDEAEALGLTADARRMRRGVEW